MADYTKKAPQIAVALIAIALLIFIVKPDLFSVIFSGNVTTEGGLPVFYTTDWITFNSNFPFKEFNRGIALAGCGDSNGNFANRNVLYSIDTKLIDLQTNKQIQSWQTTITWNCMDIGAAMDSGSTMGYYSPTKTYQITIPGTYSVKQSVTTAGAGGTIRVLLAQEYKFVVKSTIPQNQACALPATMYCDNGLVYVDSCRGETTLQGSTKVICPISCKVASSNLNPTTMTNSQVVDTMCNYYASTTPPVNTTVVNASGSTTPAAPPAGTKQCPSGATVPADSACPQIALCSDGSEMPVGGCPTKPVCPVYTACQGNQTSICITDPNGCATCTCSDKPVNQPIDSFYFLVGGLVAFGVFLYFISKPKKRGA